MEHYSKDVRNQVVEFARELLDKKPIYLDTETTGLSPQDEIVEIAVIDHDGTILFDDLVKPIKVIPDDAYRIHRISNDMVAKKRAWPILWTEIRPILYNRVISIYNADFDLRMMRQSSTAHKIRWNENLSAVDILELYARYHGEYDTFKRRYRFQSLENAGKQCGISLPNSHRALDDALLTRALLHHMAQS